VGTEGGSGDRPLFFKGPLLLSPSSTKKFLEHRAVLENEQRADHQQNTQNHAEKHPVGYPVIKTGSQCIPQEDGKAYDSDQPQRFRGIDSGKEKGEDGDPRRTT